MRCGRGLISVVDFCYNSDTYVQCLLLTIALIIFSGTVVKMHDTKTTKQLCLTKCQLHIKQHITTNESKAVLFGICHWTKLHMMNRMVCPSNWKFMVFGRLFKVLEPCQLGKHNIQGMLTELSETARANTCLCYHPWVPIHNFWIKVYKMLWYD